MGLKFHTYKVYLLIKTNHNAPVVKLANTYGSGPYVARLAGSSPVRCTSREPRRAIRVVEVLLFL